MSTTPRIPPDGAGNAHAGTIYAHRPVLGQRFSELYGTMWRRGVLDPPTKELVRIRNARVTDCGF
ncbi:MAG: hypothetical protein AAFZ07_09535 [Actinomycetota bacterium]